MSGREFLRSLLVSEFPQTSKNGGKVIVLEETTSLKKAMDILVSNNIYSAPVRSEAEEQFIGMFDMIDVVHFIAENFEEASLMGPGFEAELHQAEKFLHARVKDVVDFSRRNPFVPVPDDATMYTITELLADLKVHRVNVFNSQGELSNIITQSAMVGLIEKNLSRMPQRAQRPVGSVGRKPVVTADISDTTISAFRQLYRHGLYAVPVVNKINGNAIVANISAKDVRIVCETPAHLSLLHAPISQFLAAVHADEVDIHAPSITVKPTDTLAHAIHTLIANKIHRVYVINADNTIQSVVSLTDVLHQFIACCLCENCQCDPDECKCTDDSFCGDTVDCCKADSDCCKPEESCCSPAADCKKAQESSCCKSDKSCCDA